MENRSQKWFFTFSNNPYNCFNNCMLMSIVRTVGILSIFFGLFILGIWILLFSLKEISEIRTKKTEIYFRMFADFMTIGLSIVFGLVVVIYGKWALQLVIISLSLVIYSVFNSAGFIGQKINKKKSFGYVVFLNILSAITAAVMIAVSIICLDTYTCN